MRAAARAPLARARGGTAARAAAAPLGARGAHVPSDAPTLPPAAFLALCARLEAIAWRDVGARSTAALRVPGELVRAARLVAAARRGVLILTGFPCRMGASPPGETDGPSGAVALARAARALGGGALAVSLATDESNAPALRAALGARGLADAVCVEGFAARGSAAFVAPGAARATRARFAAALAAHDVSVAVERAGAGADGRYRTMRGLDMEGHVAPLEELLVSGTRAGGFAGPGTAPRASVGIGDGGNEAGMGAVHTAVAAAVPLGALIAATAPADATIVAGVSNWGAWALVAAIDAGRGGAAAAAPLLPSAADEAALEAVLAAEGVGDGVTGAVLPPGSVDGLPPAVHRAVLAEMAAEVDAALGRRHL